MLLGKKTPVHKKEKKRKGFSDFKVSTSTLGSRIGGTKHEFS